MSKLFKIKEWLTVPEAAKHLAIVFGEEVTEADVFRLALDEKLKISVYLSKPTKVKLVTKIPISTEFKVNIQYGKWALCTQVDEILYLRGIVDLSMIDDANSIVEAEYYRALNGKIIESNPGGIILFENDHHLYSLQESLDILRLEDEELEMSLDQYQRKYAMENYIDAWCLPENATLIIRTEALRNLEDSINETPKKIEKPLSTTERQTLLTIIAALCEYSGIYPQERGVAVQISRLTEEIGVPVSDDAIRNALDKIPNALEARRK